MVQCHHQSTINAIIILSGPSVKTTAAAEVIVFVAIQLNFGIHHIEQMAEAGIRALPIPVLTLRQIVARAWGEMSEGGRWPLLPGSTMISLTATRVNFEVGKMCDMRNVAFLAFQGSPTFCWHELTRTTRRNGVA